MRLFKRNNRLAVMLMVILSIHIVMIEPLSAITIHEEEELSDEFMMMVREYYEFVDDFMITDYVSRIGDKIVATLPEQPFQYRFYVVKDATYNAFAGPGGQIFLNSGLFAAMETVDELAGIIGHEISHVACRHISDQIERQKKIGLATLAGVAAGILMGASGASSIGSAATVGSAAAGQTLSLAYSRDDEMQADQIGLDNLTRAGFKVQGLLTMMTKIRSQQWFGSKQIPTYLMTHPAVENRIAYISSWLEEHPQPPPSAPDMLRSGFDLIHMKLVSLYDNEDLTLKKISDRLKQSPDDPVNLYGMGLIQARMGHRKEGISLLRKSLESRAFDPVILTDLGRIYFLDGNYEQALNILESTSGMVPNNLQCLYYLGRSQMELGKFKEAAESLERVFHMAPDHSETLFNLGKTYGALGKDGDACYFLGVYYRLKGDYKNALFQLERAQELGSDPEKQQEIENMIRKTKKRYRLLTREADQSRLNQFREIRSQDPFLSIVNEPRLMDPFKNELKVP
ncbi:MAG: M48 family metalloprotease [Desulfatirhabdiaceae bacterium]